MPCKWCSDGGYWECGSGKLCEQADQLLGAALEAAATTFGAPTLKPPADWTECGTIEIEADRFYFVKAHKQCLDARVETNPELDKQWELVGSLTGDGYGLPAGKYTIYTAKRKQPKRGDRCHVMVVPKT